MRKLELELNKTFYYTFMDLVYVNFVFITKKTDVIYLLFTNTNVWPIPLFH